MKSTKQGWKLDPQDVALSGSSQTSGRRKQATKAGRVTSVTGMVLELQHRPTGICVSGTISIGHYSRKEMKRLRRNLCCELFAQLEVKVAKHLRVPGR